MCRWVLVLHAEWPPRTKVQGGQPRWWWALLDDVRTFWNEAEGWSAEEMVAIRGLETGEGSEGCRA